MDKKYKVVKYQPEEDKEKKLTKMKIITVATNLPWQEAVEIARNIGGEVFIDNGK